MKTADWTIPDLLELSGGYWSTCVLHAGVKLGLFSALGTTTRTAEEVARLLNVDKRATGMLLDALSSLGLVEKQGDKYSATPFAAANLSKNSPGYLGHIIMHHHHLMAGWVRLDESVATGSPIGERVSHDDNETVRESFLMGMFNLASLLAPRIAGSVRLGDCRTLLDLGGGPGTYAIHFCLANPELTAVVYDLPTTRVFAEATITRFDLAEKISFISGDFHAEPVPTGFDVVWLSHILHADGPAACIALLRKAVAALNPGGRLMIQEFILEDSRNSPLFPALFSLNMLIGTEAGQSYSGTELATMMAKSGLTDVQRLVLELPNGAGVMSGRKE